MEANKDQAQRCRDMGLVALQGGDKQKALRLLEKSQRMYPQKEVSDLIASINSSNTDNSGQQDELNHSPSVESSESSSPAMAPPGCAPNGGSSRNDQNGKSATATSSASPRGGASSQNANSADCSFLPKSAAAGMRWRGTPQGNEQKPRTQNDNQASSRVPAPFLRTRSENSNNNTSTASSGPTSASSANSTPSPDMESQEKLCRKILNFKDYYEVLGVPRTANDDQIKNAYKKLAFQLHPDKNKASSAEEAFKKISRAFQSLSDASKRAVYNQRGDEEELPQRYATEYESDFMTPEELFEAFFGVDLGCADRRGRIYRRARRVTPQAARQQQRLGDVVQVLPVLILLAITILSSFLNQPQRQAFDFHRSASFPIEQRTSSLNVRYFTPPGFSSEFPPVSERRKQIESEVDIIHTAKLCRKEQTDRTQRIAQIRYEAQTEKELRHMIDHIEKQELLNCRNLEELKHKYERGYGLSSIDATGRH